MKLPRPEPPLSSPRDRQGRFVNYAGTVTSSPRRWSAPSSEEELAALVAATAKSKGQVRVVGAGHSWSPIAAPVDLAVRLDRLSGVVAGGPDWVRVRAGTRLRHLYRELADVGQTLPTLGSIAQQSVAGAIATGTHGSSLSHGNLSSLVLGARLVRGDGSVVEVDQGDDRLDAVRVHLGALGAVSEVTLRTTASFNLAETIEKVPLADCGRRVEEMGRSAEYVKVWWMPHTPTALAFRYERTTEPMTRWPSPQTQRLIEDWLPRVIVPPLFAWHERRSGGVPSFNRVASRWLARKRRVGPSTLMLTTPEPVRHHETEAAVPLAVGGEAFDRVAAMIDRLGLRVNFILELRYVKGDNSWMSTAYGGDVVHLGACTAITGQRHRYFDAFWQEMRRLGGRPHWGKEMDHHRDEIRSLFPAADCFLALRDEWDPDRVFTNPFLERTLGP